MVSPGNYPFINYLLNSFFSHILCKCCWQFCSFSVNFSEHFSSWVSEIIWNGHIGKKTAYSTTRHYFVKTSVLHFLKDPTGITNVNSGLPDYGNKMTVCPHDQCELSHVKLYIWHDICHKSKHASVQTTTNSPLIRQESQVRALTKIFSQDHQPLFYWKNV